MKRSRIDLNGEWHAAMDRYNCGIDQGWFSQGAIGGSVIMRVPSCLEETFPGYDGVMWYWREFTVPIGEQWTCYRLWFGAVNYLADVWFNGHYIGRHEGGTLFNLDATVVVQPGVANRLIVRVIDVGWDRIDGVVLPEVPAGREGTWGFNYGGIWQSVWLETHPAVWIEDLFAQPIPEESVVTIQVNVVNVTGQSVAATVRLEVAPDGEPQHVVGTGELRLKVVPGKTWEEVTVRIAQARLWSPADPYLYRVTATMQAERMTDETSVRFGLRQFTFKDGSFYLNGEPLYVKGFLYNSFYAATLAYPFDSARDFARKEVQRFKEAGANLMRGFCKPLVPELLDACDEMGLLVIEESEGGWNQSMSERMEEHFAREVTEMVMRDRNHPCIVAWGTINENGPISLFAYSRDVLSPRIWSELDPTRMIIESPWNAPPDNEFLPPDGRWAGFHQVHEYFFGPITATAFDRFKRLGTPGEDRLNEGHCTTSSGSPDVPLSYLVSEFGSGGPPDFLRVVQAFHERRVREDAEDHAFYEMALQRIEGGFKSFGLDRDFCTLSRLLELGQEEQSVRIRRQIEALRINPNVVGYILTAFEDQGWEMDGVFDIWRHPKAVVHILAQLNAPRLAVLNTSRRTAYRGEAVAVELYLVDDTRWRRTLAPQTVAGTLTLEDATGSALLRRPMRGELHSTIALLFADEMKVEGPTGVYTLRADISIAGRELETTHRLFIADPVDLVRPRGVTHIWEDTDAFLLPMLHQRGIAASPFNEEVGAGATIVIASFDQCSVSFARRYRNLLRLVAEQGCSAIFLNYMVIIPPLEQDRLATQQYHGALPLEHPLLTPGQYLPFKLELSKAQTRFWSSSHFVRRHPAFESLSQVHVLNGYDEYCYVHPTHSMVGEQVGEVIAGSFEAGGFGFEAVGVGNWGSDLLIVPYGEGKLVLTTYRLLENLGTDPVAEIILRNLLRWSTGG
jgi:hypothetical protein